MREEEKVVREREDTREWVSQHISNEHSDNDVEKQTSRAERTHMKRIWFYPPQSFPSTKSIPLSFTSSVRTKDKNTGS